MAEARNTDKTGKLIHLSLFSSSSHFVQQMNNSLVWICLSLLNWCNTDNIFSFIFIFYSFFFSIEFFEGVSRGGPYRWSMDRSVRCSVDPVRWTGPRTGGQCFRVTRKVKPPTICYLYVNIRLMSIINQSAFLIWNKATVVTLQYSI